MVTLFEMAAAVADTELFTPLTVALSCDRTEALFDWFELAVCALAEPAAAASIKADKVMILTFMRILQAARASGKSKNAKA